MVTQKVSSNPDASDISSFRSLDVDSFQLLYRGSRDNFTAEKFHQLCDGKGPTLTLAKASGSGRIFGGFTDVDWSSEGKYGKGAGNSFVFAFDKKLRKFECLNRHKEVYHDAASLPVFGEGHVLRFGPNQKGSSYTQSNAYEEPDYSDPNAFLAGSKNFEYAELEVFGIKTSGDDKPQKEGLMGGAPQEGQNKRARLDLKK